MTHRERGGRVRKPSAQIIGDERHEPAPPYRSVAELTEPLAIRWESRWRLRKLSRLSASPFRSRGEARAWWLINLAFLDLTQLSGGDWGNLRDDLHAFVLPQGARFGSEFDPVFVRSKQAVEEIQRWLREGLTRLVLVRSYQWIIRPTHVFVLMWYYGRVGDFPVFAGTRFADLFKLRVVQALMDDAVRFRACLECHRPFVPRKRQTYCSARCSGTLRTRKFRQAHPGEAQEARRQAYERQQRKRHGPNVKITGWVKGLRRTKKAKRDK